MNKAALETLTKRFPRPWTWRERSDGAAEMLDAEHAQIFLLETYSGDGDQYAFDKDELIALMDLVNSL